jgi:hypothetical protein
MKTKFLILIFGLLALSLLLGGCATGLTPSAWPSITTDANNAYIAAGQYVFAVNLQTGAEVWRFPAKASANPFFAAPVLTQDGQLIVGGFDKKLYSINPQTGVANSNWPFTGAGDRYIGSVLVANDLIFAPNADYHLYILTLQGKPQFDKPFKADQSIWAAPVSDGQRIYFGTLGHNVFALDAKTGKQIWDKSLDGAVIGSPVLGNGMLYVGTYGGTVYALDMATGTIRWQTPVSGWIWSGPALDGTMLYVGDGIGTLHALNASDGKETWNQKLNGAMLGTPLVTGGNVIVGTEAGTLYVFDRTGKQVRTAAVAGKLYASPVAAGTLILVAPTEGQALLVALDQNGAQKWAFTPAK